MSRRKVKIEQPQQETESVKKLFVTYLNKKQSDAWESYQENQILFMTGSAGTGKSFMAMHFAINDILSNVRQKIIITRPIVEAGERLGFLPGDLNEKVAPYMAPLYDCLNKLCGKTSEGTKKQIEKLVEVAPLAYLRGRTFENCVAILDEAQNCSPGQLKLFLTRIGPNAKLIITGDPYQSDLFDQPDLIRVSSSLKNIKGIGHIHFEDSEIVRSPIISEILKRI